MQKEDIVFEVYWDDEDGNTFYAGCRTEEEVQDLVMHNNLMIGNTRIISAHDNRAISVERFNKK